MAYQPTVRRNRVVAPMLYWLDFFSDDVKFRWKRPPRLVKMGLKYPSNRVYRMRDFMDRVKQREDDDRYISNYDGKFKQLVVQSCDDLFYRTNEDTWIRTRVTDRTPWPLRVADWCMNDNGEDAAKLVGKWIVAVLLLAMPVSIFPLEYQRKYNSQQEGHFCRNRWQSPPRRIFLSLSI